MKLCDRCGLINNRLRSTYCSKVCQSKNYQKEYYIKNKEKRKLYKTEHYRKNKEYYFLYEKKYREQEINKQKRNKYEQNKKYNDINFKLSWILRNRLNKALKNNQKIGSAVKDLGCTIEELKSHLESLWQEGMNWDNYSRNGWHIDHIKPLSSFNLEDREQFKKACHYSNLQPMWAKDNLRKGAK